MRRASLALLLALAALVATGPVRAGPDGGGARPATTSSQRVTHSVGSRWIGADLARGVRAIVGPGRAEVEVTTDARLRLLTGALPVFRVRERTTGADLDTARRRAWRGTEVELLGASRLTVLHDLLARTFKVTSVKLPVCAVGPFPVTLEAELGAYLRVRLKGETAWADGPSLATGVEGMARIGGVARLGPGAPLVKVGVKGEVDLLKARLPAMVTLHGDGVTVDLKLVLESRAAIKLFARFGVGPFTKELTVDVPYLSWRLFKVDETIARREVRWAP